MLSEFRFGVEIPEELLATHPIWKLMDAASKAFTDNGCKVNRMSNVPQAQLTRNAGSASDDNSLNREVVEAARAKFHGCAAGVSLHLSGEMEIDLNKLQNSLQEGNQMLSKILYGD